VAVSGARRASRAANASSTWSSTPIWQARSQPGVSAARAGRAAHAIPAATPSSNGVIFSIIGDPLSSAEPHTRPTSASHSQPVGEL
jgi:hypothetical protein